MKNEIKDLIDEGKTNKEIIDILSERTFDKTSNKKTYDKPPHETEERPENKTKMVKDKGEKPHKKGRDHSGTTHNY